MSKSLQCYMEGEVCQIYCNIIFGVGSIKTAYILVERAPNLLQYHLCCRESPDCILFGGKCTKFTATYMLKVCFWIFIKWCKSIFSTVENIDLHNLWRFKNITIDYLMKYSGFDFLPAFLHQFQDIKFLQKI